MPFTEQATNNTAENKITEQIFNELAENDIYLKERADTVDENIDQGVKTADTPTFEDVNIAGMTGSVESRIESNSSDLSSNIDQGVKTTDSPTFAGLTLSGALLPTSSPGESNSSTLTTTGQTYTIPRGLYHILLVASKSSSSDSAIVYLERYINGSWRIVESLSLSSGISTTSSVDLVEGLQISSGGSTNLRLRAGAMSNGSVYARLQKY